MAFTSSNYIVIGLFLLKDEPYAFDVIFGIAPVAQGVQVSQIELISTFRFVVEKDAVGREHAIAFAIVLHDIVAVLLSYSARMLPSCPVMPVINAVFAIKFSFFSFENVS